MRLSKLTLSGFKSFADRTEFTFDEPITAVVGPNGCGKSNIVDAIKWVLGERSSKSLRGKEMIDVIFAGSAGRKPLGMASVVLTFENPVVDPVSDASAGGGGDGHGAGANGVVRRGAAGGEGEEEGSAGGGARSAVEAGVEDEEGEGEEDLDGETGSVVDRRAAGHRGLPIDTDVVDVERRLYRDGTSQYLINGKRVRLRDIRELFLDTGIGADAYSIIEQGKVDAMLLASPVERRTLLEEAAGIARYKQRRVEAQRKLDRAEANLAVTREQLASTERRLRIVKGQAARAREFKRLDEELRALRLTLALDQYDDVRRREEGLTSSLAEAQERRSKAHESLSRLERAKQDAELERADLIEQRRACEAALQRAEHDRDAASQRREMTSRSIEEARSHLDAETERLERIRGEREGLVASLGSKRGEESELSRRRQEAEERLREIAQERDLARRSVGELRGELAEKRAAASNIDRERAALLARSESDYRRATVLREQLGKIASRAASNKSERERLEGLMEEQRSRLEATRARIESVEEDLRRFDEAAERLSEDRRGRATRVADLEQRHVRLESRRTTLRELDEQGEGLGEAVRTVLEKKRAGEGFGGVVGVLADLIETDSDHAAAVEAALGGDLQALVVPTLADVPSPEELAGLPGRVTFLPIDAIGGAAQRGDGVGGEERPVAALGGVWGSVGALRSVVRARCAGEGGGALVVGEESEREPIDRLLDRLLGRTLLVRDLDSAVFLAAGPLAGEGARFVTRDGVVLEADGRVVAGPSTPGSEGAGVLQRRSELESLRVELSGLSETLESEREGLAAVDSEAADVNTRATAARTEAAALHRRVATEEAALDKTSSELDRLGEEQRSLAEEIEALTGRCDALEAEQAELRSKAESLTRLHAEEEEEAGRVESRLEEAQTEAESAQERLAQAQVEAGRIGEQLGSARREISRITEALDAAQRRAEEAELALEQRRERLEQHRRVLEECAGLIESAERAACEARGTLGELASSLDAADKRAAELGERVSESRQHALAVERDFHSLEVARREVEVKRETLEQRASEDLEIDLAREYGQYRELISEEDVERPEQEAGTAEAEALRKQIRALGNVNLDSIEEEGRLEERNEELVRQVADIDEARARLSDLIARLNVASEKRFRETFEAVERNFAGQDGMFRKLFGGGRAELRLLPVVREVNGEKVQTDEIDWLESGVEVIAKPPGKEPRTISQLSGGEKSMTAVALLLSIFRSKPSCFCVLDEVDAALDEANVDRFCRVIHQFLDHSHFIVVTHHKRTMQTADRLYGVTMQERGVSTRVTVRLEQVGEGGEVSAGGSEGSADGKKGRRASKGLRAALGRMRDGDAPVEVGAESETEPARRG